MKKILLLLLLTYGFSNAQIVNIPDVNFKNKLVNTLCVDTNGDGYGDINVDTDNDGEIQISEAQAVLNLNISFPNFTPITDQISDLTGINSFINLEILDCTNNNLVSLDLSGLPNLRTMNCMNNHVSTLNVNGLNNLEYLYCDYNQISALNLTGLSNLKSLSCYNNQLSALNLTGLTNLIGLECSNNNITSLNLSSTPNLIGLRCSDNLLNTLSVNFLTNLRVLEYGNLGLNSVAINNLVNLEELLIAGGIQNSINLNPLVSLYSLRLTNTNFIEIDASNLPSLNRFYAYSNYSLSHLNIKNGNNFNPANGGNGVFLQTNPNLHFICADENNIGYINEQLLSENNTTTQVNSYCNFTPGGDFNTISGTMLFDRNNNGCEATDQPQPNIKIRLNDDTNQGATFTNSTGNYSFYTEDGNFTVTPEIENPTFFNFSPANEVVNFPIVDNSVSTNNFCITANGVHPDLEIVIAPVVPARPGFDAVYKIVYKNKGNQIMSQDYGISFFYNQHLMSFVSATTTPEANIGGALNWSYSNLMPFESRSILVTMNINAPTATNPVNIDDELTFTGNISPQNGDENTFDNLFILNQTVVGSYDPNDIQCLQGDVVSPAEIGNYLHYLIRFENTGTDYAENIVVKNIIDPAKYDLSTMQILGSSHPVNARVQGNRTEFIFQDIHLDSGGHGNILLKLKSAATLQTGDMVSNRVSIYFDYNYPVDTNNAETVFENLSVSIPTFDNSMKIYPNPANEFVNIKASTNINSVEIYDVQGRILATSLFNETSTSLDLTKYSSGIYYLKIKTEQGSKVEELIKK